MSEDKVQTPSIGRIVLFKVSDGASGPNMHAAIVTAVYPHSPLKADLKIMSPMSGVWDRQGVEHGTEPGEWSWPPRVESTVTMNMPESVLPKVRT